MLSKAGAAQRYIYSITAATAHNASPPPRSAQPSKAELEHEKSPGDGGLALDADFF